MVLVVQLCLTLCKPMDCSPPASSVPGIFQSRINWSELPFPSPWDVPDPGIKPGSPELQADSLPSEPTRQSDLTNGFLLADASAKTEVLVDNLTAVS